MLGGPVLKQHVVEFVRGVGVITDGVVDATSLNGPWSWTVPDGVAQIEMDGCGAGGGGGGGWNAGVSRSGGGGAGSGQVVLGAKLPVAPRSTLTVVVGSKGIGGPAGAPGTDGGNTTIAGVLPGAPLAGLNEAPDLQTIWIRGGGAGGSSSSQGGEGGKPGSGRFQYGMDGGLLGPNNAATPPNGNDNSGATAYTFGYSFSLGCRGASGAAASTTGAVKGGDGGITHAGRYIFHWTGGYSTRAPGNTDGTTSYGGGGRGGFTNFGRGGPGGAGQAPGGDADGYGGGGGGGGGNAPGGNASDGYVRFTYWSAD